MIKHAGEARQACAVKVWTTYGCTRAEITAGSRAHGNTKVQESRPEGSLQCSIMDLPGLENFAYLTVFQQRS